MEMKEGHSAGFESLAKALETCYDCGVEVATVFAFSIENFNRSRYEVEWLMELGKSKFRQVVGNGELCEKYGIKIRVLGNLDLLPSDLKKVLLDAEELTKNNTRAVLNVCWPYTSRDDMTHAVRKIVSKRYEADSITEDLISKNLYTGGLPKLDLLIRTSAVYRLSDFMLWECVDPDCDIEIVSVLWPAFSATRMVWVLLKWGFGRTYYGRRMAKVLNIEHAKDE
ncbi:DEKNAAC102844 [Brettanomyces naardenensis]|uniref:Alkyl transferase n=1 Tax=Brettanomyces naardenensis TaxID=13370 RepID=A0A448YLU8_BRENA|nr:DEKNAAC102844 [Brettanomyces naardenensis]